MAPSEDTKECECRIWTRRQTLGLTGVPRDARYSLPLLLSEAEADVSLLAAGKAGAVFCRDGGYELEEKQLLWIERSSVKGSEDVILYKYLDPVTGGLVEGSQPEGGSPEAFAAKQRRAEEVLLLADFFNKGLSGSFSSWVAFYEDEAALELVTVVPLPAQEASRPGHAPVPGGQALRLDPSRGRLALRRSIDHGEADQTQGRLHLRSFFYDEMGPDDAGHWLGLSSRYGTFALGVAPGMEETYGFLNGLCPNGAPFQYFGWLRSSVERSRGWHLFEAILETGHVTLQVDGSTILHAADAFIDSEASENLWLVAKRGACGCWAAVELVHTLPGMTGTSWEIRSEETGHWKVDEQGAVWRMEEMKSASSFSEEMEESRTGSGPGWPRQTLRGTASPSSAGPCKHQRRLGNAWIISCSASSRSFSVQALWCLRTWSVSATARTLSISPAGVTILARSDSTYKRGSETADFFSSFAAEVASWISLTSSSVMVASSSFGWKNELSRNQNGKFFAWCR